MDNITEKDYAHWLFNVRGVGNDSIDRLLCSGRNCSDIYEMKEKELAAILTPRKARYIVESRNIWDFRAERQKLLEKGIKFISRIDDEFPEKLKNIPDPPFALYIKGKLPDPDKPAVAIVGARMCSDYGRYMARQLGKGLALSGVQVISGLARGIDGIGQKAALSAGGASFGVVGCGVDICYPEENREIYDGLSINGGVISEYPPGTMPKANFFPMRNRIISGLSDVVVVVEARLHSGTQITVDQALEQGKEVLAVPGRVTDRLSDGCNYLISQGAGVAITTEDVIDRIWGKKKKEKVIEDQTEAVFDDMEEGKTLSIDEQILEIVDVIPISASVILEELYRRGIELTVPNLIGKLMDLTCQGIIVQEGAYYRKAHMFSLTE